MSKTATVPGTPPAAEKYPVHQLPAVQVPRADYQLTEVIEGLTGVVAEEPAFNLDPENSAFTSGS